jgi:hypothetical protein
MACGDNDGLQHGFESLIKALRPNGYQALIRADCRVLRIPGTLHLVMVGGSCILTARSVKCIPESGPPARSFLVLEPGVESAESGPLHRTFSD